MICSSCACVNVYRRAARRHPGFTQEVALPETIRAAKVANIAADHLMPGRAQHVEDSSTVPASTLPNPSRQIFLDSEQCLGRAGRRHVGVVAALAKRMTLHLA